jgi:ABC-type branched-subunit amino acid transport system ATPase component
MSVFEHLKLVSGLKNETNVSVRIEDIAKSIGITKFISSISLKSRGGYLSGGEKQILKLMMALMNNPKCLILDEISAGMSPANLEIISETVRKIKEQKSISIILIEQNIRLAQQLSDRILLLERGVIDREFLMNEEFNPSNLNENIFN